MVNIVALSFLPFPILPIEKLKTGTCRLLFKLKDGNIPIHKIIFVCQN